MRPRLLTLFALLAAAASAAHAEPRPASKGPYAEIGMGASRFIGPGSQYSKMGPDFALRAGLDVFSWLSVGARLQIESHQADVPPPPAGEYYQLYTAGGDGRISIPVGWFGIFAEGGVGFTMVSTNVLEQVDLLDPGEKWTPFFSAGGGIEYQLQNRHYALGLAGAWTVLPKFSGLETASARLYLRYTY